ncbi:HTH-type transcriptional regulator [Beijerinckiaceae bacterium RH AL1]|nr:MarR family transcriptional regulator [Beijerinckiaceae bacterium]VVB45982.1 HTH-type transcriptional regulator [Beijerinckiaceae bacterium RH CH11]VVB46062.1 HTH-type transcriptional regulator [Beijerinckiaceae bacterium RH AL8]VVC55140.1 HTH-type transcriptional regulator [Beijerinckiaceae bacterium RH AL1]
MTETTDDRVVLPAAFERFVLAWGSLGGAWGVNRSVSQIHALLYLSEAPLTMDAIVDTLGIARSNVSTSLKVLMAWGLVRRAPVKGDRREHFEAETDIWEIAALIAAGRKQREIDPALAALKTCVAEANADPKMTPVARKRLVAMLEFTEMADRWHTQMMQLPKSKLASLVGLGARVIKFIPLGKPQGRTPNG